jgi:hypothetical protein
MTVTIEEEIGATTRTLYLYAVKVRKPINTREVMRALDLSSSSVAYRHLQKLESLNLLQRNAYGEYFLKEKADLKGYLWVGRNLFPRLLIYSVFFFGLFAMELTIVTTELLFLRIQPDTNFLYLTVVTALAGILFSIEWVSFVSISRKSRRQRASISQITNNSIRSEGRYCRKD